MTLIDTPSQALAGWRRRYEDTANAPTWLESHQWKYGPEVARATAEEIRRKLRLEPHHSILEVGAGTGGFLAQVLHDGQQGLAVDFCHAMLRRGLSDPHLCQNISFLAAEAAAIPIANHSVDRVLCYSVIQYFPSADYARKAVLEMIRVCKPEGVILIGDVCGVLERPLRFLQSWGSPEFLTEAVLAVLTPVHNVRAHTDRMDGLRFLRFPRRFFTRIFSDKVYKIEVLDQNIPGRRASETRFDVRITKSAADRDESQSSTISSRLSTAQLDFP